MNLARKKVLITGGSSYLGRHLVPLARTDFETVYTYFHQDPLQLTLAARLDVRDPTAVSHLFHTVQPDAIIHTVGSNRPNDMSAVIRLGTQHVTQAASDAGARLIHLSTDSIFAGTNPPYDETAVPSPVNEYGRAKADAETIVQQHPNHVIIRTSLIYGLQEMDHGTAWMAAALQAGEPVTLFTNQRRNPVWVETLCRACLELITHDFTGILNVAGRQVMTRADFALKMLDWWHINIRDNLTLSPSPPGKWPLDCELDLRRATAVLSTPLYGVDDVLHRIAP